VTSGLLLLDKPSGVTSFDCVAVVRRVLGVKRVGHCGTLDPAAKGLLLILVGSATKTQDSFLGLEKEYWFRAELGRKTATGDLEGDVQETTPFSHVTQELLQKTLENFVGDIQQVPPIYSALKYHGKPFYHYARKGQSIPMMPRTVTIRSIELLSFELPYWEARVVCSRGTYVRTLAEDVASRMNTCGTLVDLVRERIGPYRRDEAMSLESVRNSHPTKLIKALQVVTPECLSRGSINDGSPAYVRGG
jgi:tRNA pseudouridine55 synthase